MFRVPPNTIWKVFNRHNKSLGVYAGHPADIAATLSDRSCGLLKFVHEPIPIEVDPPKALEDEVMVRFEGHGAPGQEEEWLASGASKLSHTAHKAIGGDILILYTFEASPSPVEPCDCPKNMENWSKEKLLQLIEEQAEEVRYLQEELAKSKDNVESLARAIEKMK